MTRLQARLFVLGLLSWFPHSAISAQTPSITGIVVEARGGAPIGFATIAIEGSTIRVSTEEDGRFQVLGAPIGPVRLRVEHPGYRTRHVLIGADRYGVRIELTPDYLDVEAIVATGRATSARRAVLPYTVALLDGRELNRVPSQSVEQTLQGRVAGVDVQSNSGAPGGGFQVNLRGVSTIIGSPEPLYVVDGVIASNIAIPSGQNFVTQATAGSNLPPEQDNLVNRITDLNPADIEKIEILKGPAASAIYGSKSSNGVILITTRRGRQGPLLIDVVQRVGVHDLSHTIGSRTFQSVEEATAVFGPAAADLYRSDRMFDQEEMLAGRHDLSTETQLTLSGGIGGTRVYASGLVRDDEGIIVNTGYEKQSARINLDQQIGNRWNVAVRTELHHSTASRGLTNNDTNASSFYVVLPFTPSFLDLQQQPDGSYPVNPFVASASNPVQTAALMTNDEDVWRVMGSLRASFNAWHSGPHDIEVLAIGGMDWFRQRNDLLFPAELHFEPRDDGLAGTVIRGNGENLNRNVGANVIHEFARSSYSATTSAGLQYEDSDLEQVRIVSEGLGVDPSSADTGVRTEISDTRERVEDWGAYVQEDLLLMNQRLSLIAALRGERSSTVGDTEEIFLYPKLGAAYRWELPIPEVDAVKLRAAYGESGNRPRYGQRFRQLLGTRVLAGNPGLTLDEEAGNPAIRPERAREVEAGVDALLFSGRAAVELSVYQKNIYDLLLARVPAPSSGFRTEFFNGGELRVRGVEVTLRGTPLQTRRLLWESLTTFGADRSEITELPIPAFIVSQGFGVGLGAFRIEPGASATQIVGHDGLDENGLCCEIRRVGDTNPDFRVGLGNEIRWENWSLYGLLDWQSGGDVINITRFLYDLGQNSPDFLSGGLERLERVGTETSVYVEDASFVKLRELKVAYDFEGERIRDWGLPVGAIQLSASGRNLFTWTGYSGLDPEVSNFGNQPIARNYDVAPFPPSRSLWLSVAVIF